MMRLLAATALASTLLVQPALAQSAQPQATDTGAGIGEIVVTAQKRAENVQDVPIAISAVSSQFLQSRAISSIDGLGAIAPNLVVDRAPSNKTATQIATTVVHLCQLTIGEQTVTATGEPVPSGADQMTRAKNFDKNLKYFITPHSMHYIAQNKFKLNLLAAQGKGVIIDPETMAHAFDIPNWGSIDGSTVKEKVFEWAKEQLTEKAEIAKLEKALGLAPPPEEGKPGPSPGKGGAPAKKPGQGKVKQKGAASGGRVVVATT